MRAGNKSKTKKKTKGKSRRLRTKTGGPTAAGSVSGLRERAYAKFFDITEDLFCVAGLDGYFKLINPAFEKLLGYTKKELLSKPFYDFVHPDEKRDNLGEVRSLTEGTSLEYCEHRYLCKDGSYKWLAWTSHTDIDEGLVYAVAKDITRLKSAEEAIQKIHDELENPGIFSSIITGSNKMRAIFHYVEAIAGSGKPVLITGETGTGKEMLARCVHGAIGLKGRYVAVNVAGLDDTMFSDTLFGHKRGAYTGADRDRLGLIVEADGGTLLLDEIGDLSSSSQVKLLRLLEEKIYYPLGSDVPEKSNAFVIACTNQDVEDLVLKDKFRRDLYYRLKVHYIHIPPLRERVKDIPLLFRHFLEEAARSMKKRTPVVPDELITILCNYEYPGNVRELQAMVHDAVARNRSGKLGLDIFKEYMDQGRLRSRERPQERDIGSGTSGRFPTLKEAEDNLISRALERSKGNQGIAASLLGISRQALNQRLKRKKRPA